MTARDAFDASGIRTVLDPAGKLVSNTPPDMIANYLRAGFESLNGCGPLEATTLRELFVLAGVKANQADAAVRERQGPAETTSLSGSTLDLSDPEPWPEPVDGDALLDEIAAAFRRYLALPDGADVILALWTLFAHAHDAFAVSPMLAFVSPIRGAGKTTALTVLSALLPRPMFASNLTGPVLFRAVERFEPTLLIDEADTILRDREDLRTILNASHSRRTAIVPRTVGDEYEPRLFSTWCPKAIAMIGDLPATLHDRSLVIHMRRRRPDEIIQSVRLDRLDSELGPILRRAIRWAADHEEQLRQADPMMPDELRDRAADNARPLLAVADAAGGNQPETGRMSLVVNLTRQPEDDTEVRTLLLSDMRAFFNPVDEVGRPLEQIQRLRTTGIVATLVGMDDRPWGEWRRGNPLSGIGLARLLKPFGVRPKTIRFADGVTLKGYELEDFKDVFVRYLPIPLESTRNTRNNPHKSATNDTYPTRNIDSGVTGREPGSNVHKSANVTGVTGQIPLLGGADGEYEVAERLGMELEQ